jgi:hypothetical protein
MFKKTITTRAELRGIIAEPHELVLAKSNDSLDQHCQALIAHSPFVLLASSSRLGRCDVSPRGDAPGFVQVLDKKHLALPDRPGNQRLDSLENILENPQVGLLFMIPGTRETLRVNGKAWLIQDDEVLDRAVVNGKRPLLALGIEVQEAFIHCAKALLRSKLWQSESWPDLSDLPSFARMFLDHVNAQKPRTDISEPDLAEALDEAYRTELY